mmetsp:Transcript_52807/g.140975  ORF Transcript_52807/g.140975 Transcript_52807/m.140975 type:complete len:318 (+) Transcript_52807:772-1725(+)
MLAGTSPSHGDWQGYLSPFRSPTPLAVGMWTSVIKVGKSSKNSVVVSVLDVSLPVSGFGARGGLTLVCGSREVDSSLGLCGTPGLGPSVFELARARTQGLSDGLGLGAGLLSVLASRSMWRMRLEQADSLVTSEPSRVMCRPSQQGDGGRLSELRSSPRMPRPGLSRLRVVILKVCGLASRLVLTNWSKLFALTLLSWLSLCPGGTSKLCGDLCPAGTSRLCAPENLLSEQELNLDSGLCDGLSSECRSGEREPAECSRRPERSKRDTPAWTFEPDSRCVCVLVSCPDCMRTTPGASPFGFETPSADFAFGNLWIPV